MVQGRSLWGNASTVASNRSSSISWLRPNPARNFPLFLHVAFIGNPAFVCVQRWETVSESEGGNKFYSYTFESASLARNISGNFLICVVARSPDRATFRETFGQRSGRVGRPLPQHRKFPDLH